jgi:methylated-DNA-[protein]-cysteine S-methyltransferase
MHQPDNLFVAEEILGGIKINVISSGNGIQCILLNSKSIQEKHPSITKIQPDNPKMFTCFKQLDEYFNRSRKYFDLSLEIIGTEFQKKVWHQLQTIKYGETISYRDLAITLGDIKSIRAVGRANGANPLPIVIPCHRIIGTDGKLVGYGGGLNVKKKLLELEGSLDPNLFA